MLMALTNREFLKLFLAQIVALLGTGLLTIALGLMAYDIAAEDAGIVLGIALTIKMIAYVVVAPVSNALFSSFDRRKVMIAADLIRAIVALGLVFVDSVWQIYLLIMVLQTASATFTPAFQATIPDILPKKEDYTQALSLSRLAYDIENIASPLLAGLLLGLIEFHWLFAGTSVGFVTSALFVFLATFPIIQKTHERSFLDRLTLGSRIYLATPRLRGLLCLSFAGAAASAMVLVNTVVIVQSVFQRPQQDLALAMGIYGLGSILAAVVLPKLLSRIEDRLIMLVGGGLLVISLCVYVLLGLFGWSSWLLFLGLLFLTGLSYSTTITPSGRLLQRSAHPEDRPTLFTAQFALSHGCWLITYPLAGIVGSYAGLELTAVILAGLAALGVIGALVLWPPNTRDALFHDHSDLPADHPHLTEWKSIDGTKGHQHVYLIDKHHVQWPDR